MKALYAVNLIEANLNHYDGKSNAWKDANLNEILAKIEAGDNERSATFGQRMYRVQEVNAELDVEVEQHSKQAHPYRTRADKSRS